MFYFTFFLRVSFLEGPGPVEGASDLRGDGPAGHPPVEVAHRRHRIALQVRQDIFI